MKTIQEYLGAADRQRLLDCLAYRFLSDPLRLLEAREYTVQEIMERYSGHMNSFIERLLGVEIAGSDTHVFYLYPDYRNDEVLDLADLKAIEADIEAPGLDFSFTEWRESLGYLVADTKLTQDNMIQLLAQYLEQASFFRTEEATRSGRIDEIVKDLDAGIQSMREGESMSADVVFDKLCRKHGFPIPEKDFRQDELYSAVMSAIHEYGMYGRTRERKRILAALAPSG